MTISEAMAITDNIKPGGGAVHVHRAAVPRPPE
jgi:hypothetical protein